MKIHWPKIHSFRRHLEIKVLWESDDDDDEMMPRGFLSYIKTKHFPTAEQCPKKQISISLAPGRC